MNEYLSREDWRVRANANQGYSLGGLMLNVSGKITANYWLKAFARVLPHCDWVGFDVKALAEEIELITGVSGSSQANWQCLETLNY